MKSKAELRKEFKTVRSAFTGNEREIADNEILKIFLKEFGGYESYFIYNSFFNEADTKGIIAELLKAGKRVYLPKIEGKNMFAVPFGETQKGAFGIDEPTGQPYFGDIDVTVIPLLAVNKKLFRIGYGRGYYDKFLKDKRTKKIGLGYSFQIADFIEDKWDEPLDMFLCEKGVIYR